MSFSLTKSKEQLRWISMMLVLQCWAHGRHVHLSNIMTFGEFGYIICSGSQHASGLEAALPGPVLVNTNSGTLCIRWNTMLEYSIESYAEFWTKTNTYGHPKCEEQPRAEFLSFQPSCRCDSQCRCRLKLIPRSAKDLEPCDVQTIEPPRHSYECIAKIIQQTPEQPHNNIPQIRVPFLEAQYFDLVIPINLSQIS